MQVLETIDHAIGQHVLSDVSTGECVAVILAGVFVGAHIDLFKSSAIFRL